MHLVSFFLNSDRYTQGTLSVKGPEISEVYVDGKPLTLKQGEASLTLEPRRYEVVVKYLSEGNQTATLKASFSSGEEAIVTATTNPEKRYTLTDVLHGERIQSVSLSPSGKMLIIAYRTTFPGGKQASRFQIVEKTTGKLLAESEHSLEWMPKSDLAYFTRKGMEGTELVTLDPLAGKENVLVRDLPEGMPRFSPTEDFLLLSIREEGPKENDKLQQILVPDDRQPGWRDRVFIHKYDLKTGVCQRLTYGHTSTYINDISRDGRYLLFSCREPNLTERPFSRTSLYKMDLRTLRVETIFKSEKFLSRTLFSPDAKQLLVNGSGEAFDGIGLNIKKGQTSNMGDGQLFLCDVDGKNIRPLTGLPFDVHLMVEHPKTQIKLFAEAGADIITVHYEACAKISPSYLKETLELIRSYGVKSGAVVNPDTDVENIYPVLDVCDMAVVMSVFPGYGGQKFIPSALEQVAKLRAYALSSGRKDLVIEVDGGITCGNVAAVRAAGADIAVAGSAVFGAADMAAAISALKS